LRRPPDDVAPTGASRKLASDRDIALAMPAGGPVIAGSPPEPVAMLRFYGMHGGGGWRRTKEWTGWRAD